MKTAFQLAASTLALVGLLTGPASHAVTTNLAELPLKASVLAKPNVIFGMDDSSSMDGEIMLYNNDGAFWWDYDNASGWGVDSTHPNASLRTITSTWFNNVGDATSRWRKMVYLFPNGTGLGNRVLADNSDGGNAHFAVLPTTQFASLRWSGVYLDGSIYRAAPSDPALSSMHNPIYYNPLVTYAPWAPAQLSTGAVTPTNATVTAARSHPMYGTGTVNLTANIAATTAGDNVFTAFPGMRIPAGSQKSVCNASNASCGAWTNVPTEEAAAANRVTRVSMAHYAPTFWVREACAVPSTVNVATDSCTYLPGSSSVTLKRYEIKSGNTFPSGRSYAAEMQNFANWYQYYRKRKLMLAGAMGETMENLSGMRLGVIAFNSLSGDVTMYDADATAAASNRLRVAGIFYEANGSGGTPTRPTLKYIGEQFKRTDQTSGRYNMIQYACQRNNAFIVTDGFANNDSTSPPLWDAGKSAANWGTGAPYAQDFTHNGTLADLALRYYTNNPRSSMATGKLQSTPRDGNTDLHMNTYGLTLGARGTLFLSESSAVPTTTAAWPDPNTNRNPTSVDDLWHATINGRGKMYLATTPEETALRIRAGLDDILSQEGAQGGVAVSAVNLDQSDSRAYLGVYDPRGWSGDLTANPINVDTAVISTTPTWRAATVLAARTWGTRNVFTASGTTGIDFTATNVGSVLNPDSATFTNQQVVDFVRGSRVGEGDTVRLRSSLISAVVNAEPVLARDERVVYLASGEGLLHAFDTVDGSEQWAFVPPDQIANIGKSVPRGWAYQTLLDATPTYARLSSGAKLLVGGLGAAGRSYYALDVSAPRGITAAQAAAQFRWIFPATGDSANRALMGYTVGKPVVVRTAADGNVVLVTSGYDNGQSIGDGRGRLWMLNATNGAVIKTFRTTVGAVGSEAGLAHVSAFKEADGMVRYVYGGDLLGNIWRFDLTSTTTGEINGTLIASLRDGSGNAQPVTSAPELTTVSAKRVVLVGTGRILDIGDFGSTATQSFYAIADGTTLANARTGLVSRTFTRATDTLSGGAFNWATDRGWYFDLPASEQANTDPVIAYGAVIFITNVNGSSDCSQMSYQYLVDIGTGSKVAASTQYPTPFASRQLSATATSSRAIVVKTRDGKIHSKCHLSNNQICGEGLPLGGSIKPSKNAWREIRR